MIETSDEYKIAITGDSRKTLLRAIVDIISPDIEYGAVTSSGETAYSKSEQMHDKIFDVGKSYATLEHNRWVLDGTWKLAPPETDAQVGFESKGIFDAAGEGSFFALMPFSGVSILQACSVYFPDNGFDGFAVDFEVSVIGDNTYTQAFEGNLEPSVSLTGFTVNNPTAIKVTVTKWSLPSRRMRIPEIIPGVYEVWGNDILAEFSVIRQTSFTGMTLPYGTCHLSMDNADARFAPRKKDGLFQSIEERQGIEFYIAPRGAEYVPLGVFYQYSGGWKSSSNGLTMTWELVDIIGLLANRAFKLPTALPTRLWQWAAAIVGQLGVNFESRYIVPDDIYDLAITTTADLIEGQSCGQILLWLCQASGTFPQADAETGYLRLSKLPQDGGRLSLDDMTSYPVTLANNDIARLDFTLPDGAVVSIDGTSDTSPNTASVQNPFIKTASAAETAAEIMLKAYGGNAIETSGRGDPSQELGDVISVELKGGEVVKARLMYQTIQMQGGVMKNCASKMLEIKESEVIGS